ncbi:uncharacterized protein METZ01_LOCUS252612 [marine metagenome]|uniref:Uncharacterized protein n=1 Tax=marine metagenome TaxID=408172 RepID=A0A382IJL4_9ZZZZ
MFVTETLLMYKLAIGTIGIILILLALYIAVIVSLILFDSKVDIDSKIDIKRYSDEINPIPFQHVQPPMPFQHNQPPMQFQHNQPPMPFQHNPMPITPKDWKWNEKEKGDRRPSIEMTVEDFDKLISELKLEQKMLTNQLEIEISRFELEIDHFSKQKDKLK